MFYSLLQNIGYDDNFNESDFTIYLREKAIKWACVLGVDKCRRTATSKVQEHLQSSKENKLSSKYMYEQIL